MTFLWPHLLWLALLAPATLLAGPLLRMARPRRPGAPAPAPANIRSGIVAGGRVRFDGKARRATSLPWRFWLAFLLVVVALARPQWGRLEQAPGSDAPGEVVIALDLSRSMLATDMAPSRLERARAVATQLVKDLPDRRVALIGFAGTAHLLAPASEDRAILQAFLPIVTPAHIVAQGTNFAALLDVGLAAFGPAQQGRCLVILTDGEVEPGVWQDRIAALKGRGIRVVAVGLGTPGGASLVGPDRKPLRDRAGAPVVSRLNSVSLSELAEGTGGQYIGAERSRELAGLVRTASAEPPTGSGAATGAAPGRADRFAWFLGAALLLLAWSAAREYAAEPRLRRRRVAAQAGVVLSGVLLLAMLPPQRSEAAKPLITETDLQGEEEPLKRLSGLVGQLLRKDQLSAADYLAVVDAATRYGEIHRGHGHPIEEGVLHDGLAAIELGRRLDPALADWAKAKDKLERLLVPPPSVPMDDPGPPDPANEPMDGAGQAPVPGEDAKDSGPDPAPKDAQEPTAGEQGLQNVGGSQRDVFDPSEWRNAALVQPLDQLERLRGTDSPAELFQLMQRAAAKDSRRTEQSW
jgi:Ca-activated chloride channel family protein